MTGVQTCALPICGVVIGAGRLALVVASALLAPALACAADIETRDFFVFVSGKRSGEVHMTIHRKDKGLVGGIHHQQGNGYARGGNVHVTAGGGSGLGRLERTKIAEKVPDKTEV